MDDKTLRAQIGELVDEEHRLRSRSVTGHGLSIEQRLRLEHLEEQLDQTWDLLRRRLARREAGQDPEVEAPRPVRQVETYLQ